MSTITPAKIAAARAFIDSAYPRITNAQFFAGEIARYRAAGNEAMAQTMIEIATRHGINVDCGQQVAA